MMKAHTKPLEHLLSNLCPPSRTRRIVNRLLAADLLNVNRMRSLALALYVAGEVDRGRAKTEALEQAAYDFGCSYSTACRDVYDPSIQQIIKQIRK